MTHRIWYPVMAGGNRKQYEIRSSKETDMKDAIINTTPYHNEGTQ